MPVYIRIDQGNRRAKNHGRTKLRLVFSLLAYKYTTDTKKRERERRTKKKMYAGRRLTYFVAVQSRCGKGGGGGAGIHKNGHHLSELA